MNIPTYPDIHVHLTGKDGNAFAIMGAVIRAMKLAGLTPESVAQYQNDAMDGDYDNLLRVTMQTVTVS